MSCQLTGGAAKITHPRPSPVYYGDRARYHYFQCLQLVLRHQIKALTRLWKLPAEFEVRLLSSAPRISIDPSQIVCRDIWALHLGSLPHAISPEPLLHKQDGEAEPTSIKGFSEQEPVHSRPFRDAEDEGSDASSSASSSSEEEKDPELEALLEQLSASSEEDDANPSSTMIEQNRPARQGRGIYDLPANNIAVLILACWTLRIPITFRDFTK